MILLKALLITVLVFALMVGWIALFVFFPVVGLVITCIIAFIAVLANVYESIL